MDQYESADYYRGFLDGVAAAWPGPFLVGLAAGLSTGVAVMAVAVLAWLGR